MFALRKILLCIVLCLPGLSWSQSVAQPKFTETVSAFALRVRTDDLHDTKNLAVLSALLAREADRLLQLPGSVQQTLTIHLLEQDELKPSDAENLFLSRQDRPVQLFFAISKAIIQRRVREFLRRDNLSLDSSNWLAAALCNRVFYDGLGTRTFFVSDYRIARSQFLAGHFPQIELLLSRPMPAEDGALFRLYLQHCDLLVRTIESSRLTSGEFFRRLFEMEAYGRQGYEAFEFLLKPEWHRLDRTLQDWYTRNVLNESGKGWQRADSAEVVEQLQELITVPLLQAGRSNAVRRVPLDQMPRVLEDYRINTLALTLLQNKMLKLQIAAPPLLQEPIQLYGEALQLLKNDKIRSFKKKFQEAQRSFQAAQSRQERITALLDQLEKERRPVLQDFALFLQVDDKYEAIRRSLLP